jgi:hypothetical protein
VWITDKDGLKIFADGRAAWTAAAGAARQCLRFSPDDEDEWVADESCSCYNCRYRRWTAQSFSCQQA